MKQNFTKGYGDSGWLKITYLQNYVRITTNPQPILWLSIIIGSCFLAGSLAISETISEYLFAYSFSIPLTFTFIQIGRKSTIQISEEDLTVVKYTQYLWGIIKIRKQNFMFQDLACETKEFINNKHQISYQLTLTQISTKKSVFEIALDKPSILDISKRIEYSIPSIKFTRINLDLNKKS